MYSLSGLSRIWTQVSDFISYTDNHYAKKMLLAQHMW